MMLKIYLILLCITLVGCQDRIVTKCLTNFDEKTVQQGDTVCLYGKLHDNFEDVAVHEQGNGGQAVWLTEEPGNTHLERLSNNTIEVKGIVDNQNKGHPGGYLYSIHVLEVNHK